MQKLNALWLLMLTAPLAADTPAPGFSSTSLPNGGYRTVTLSNGQYVRLDPSSVRLFSATGVEIQVLHTFSAGASFAEAMAVDPEETFVVVSRAFLAGGGETYRVELDGGATLLGPQGPIEWVVFEDGDTALFASIGGVCCWDLWRVQVDAGTYVNLASSGARAYGMEVDQSGNLYLGHSAPSGPGYVIERFGPHQFAAPGTLVFGEGQIIYESPEVPWAMDLSPDESTLFVAVDHSDSRIVAVPLDGNAPVQLALVDGFPRDLQSRPGTPPAAFLAYQPASGGELIYQAEVDNVWQRQSLRPARPTLTLSGPGTTGVGTVDLAITGGPASGQATLFRGPLSLFNPDEVAYLVGGIPIFIGLDLATAVKIPVPIPLDRSGTGVWEFNNERDATSIWALQAALQDARNILVGTTTAAFL